MCLELKWMIRDDAQYGLLRVAYEHVDEVGLKWYIDFVPIFSSHSSFSLYSYPYVEMVS